MATVKRRAQTPMRMRFVVILNLVCFFTDFEVWNFVRKRVRRLCIQYHDESVPFEILKTQPLIIPLNNVYLQPN